MHDSAFQLMAGLVARYRLPGGGTVLDVGSREHAGGHRPLFPLKAGWLYTGLDVRTGPNVDVVAPPYDYPFADGSFDLVVSGQTIEHVADLARWAKEVARVVKPGGRLIVIGPWSWRIHGHPKSYPDLCDYWRVLPDGLRLLFGEIAGLTILDCDARETEAFCVAQKQ